jgi:large subunit ribosomal protein L33
VAGGQQEGGAPAVLLLATGHRPLTTFRGAIMAKESREMVWLQCTETGDLNYRTEIKVAGGAQKVEVKKYNPKLRRHTVHKVKRK